MRSQVKNCFANSAYIGSVRKVGRPRKDKVLNVIAKNPVGRPRKDQVLNVIAKNPVGRPRKDQVLNVIAKNPVERPCKDPIVPTKLKGFTSNKNKNFINTKFAGTILSAMKKYKCNDNNYFIGALDSVENNTSECLIYNGIEKENILLVESNSDIARSHIEKNFKTYYGSLEDFANNVDKIFIFVACKPF